MFAIRSSAARFFLVLSAGALALTSCGKINHMQEVTDDMSDTTKRMEQTTCMMYAGLRQVQSKDSRGKDLNDLKNAEDINEKLAIAAKYMQSFEYEAWSASCSHITSLDIALDQATTELLTTVAPYAKDRSKVNATKQSAEYATLYALAATLHRTNEAQTSYLQGSGRKALRPLDLLTEGLRLNQAKNRGEITDAQLPAWARTVGKYASDAKFILRLRGNFLMAYGYAVADSDEFGNTPNTMEKVWRLMTTKFFSKKWTPGLDRRDPTEISERITVSLLLAKETREALEKLGIDPMVDETMMKVWKDADFSRLDLVAMKKGSADKDDPARADAIKDLISARNQLLADEKPEAPKPTTAQSLVTSVWPQ